MLLVQGPHLFLTSFPSILPALSSHRECSIRSIFHCFKASVPRCLMSFSPALWERKMPPCSCPLWSESFPSQWSALWDPSQTTCPQEPLWRDWVPEWGQLCGPGQRARVPVPPRLWRPWMWEAAQCQLRGSGHLLAVHWPAELAAGQHHTAGACPGHPAIEGGQRAAGDPGLRSEHRQDSGEDSVSQNSLDVGTKISASTSLSTVGKVIGSQNQF